MCSSLSDWQFTARQLSNEARSYLLRRMIDLSKRQVHMDGHLWLNVTGFGKTLRMGFFLKFEFDAWLISSIIELIRIQVLGRSHALLWRYSALFHTPNNYMKLYARVWRFRILRVTQKSIKWTWAEPFEMNVKIEQLLTTADCS